MRLQAVPILMVTLAVCSASSKWRSHITPTTESGIEAAKYIFGLFNQQTTPESSQRNLETTRAPGECYTENQDVGKCVKTSMCDMEPPKIDATTLFDYKMLDKSEIDCEYLQICCPIDKIRTIPVPPTISTPPGCGYSNPAASRFRELMGTSDSGYADYAEFPWMVALLKNSVNNQASDWNDTDFLGGGTLIHPSVVLTVAHKVDTMAPSDLKCRAGEWDTEHENEQYIHQDREVKKIILHEQFERQHARYDAALLIMKTPFSIQPNINVACLSQTMPLPGTLCYSMGWGMDFTVGKYNANVLKKIPLPLIDPDYCESMLKKTILGKHFTLHRSLTCAGGVPDVDTCSGDGGSSLVCPVGEPSDLRYSMVGMVVYGLKCGTETPGTYANIPEIYDWVNRQMNREGFRDRLYTI